MLRATGSLRIKERILLVEVVETAPGNDFEHRQREIAKHSDGQFPTGNEFFDQKLVVVLGGFAQGRGELSFFLHDIDADSRSLAWRLDHAGERKCGLLADPDDFPMRRGHAVLSEHFFREGFVESEATLVDAFAGVRNAAILENLLQLSVFAEGAVDGEKRQFGVVRQNEVGILGVDFGNVRA